MGGEGSSASLVAFNSLGNKRRVLVRQAVNTQSLCVRVGGKESTDDMQVRVCILCVCASCSLCCCCYARARPPLVPPLLLLLLLLLLPPLVPLLVPLLLTPRPDDTTCRSLRSSARATTCSAASSCWRC